MNQNTQHTTVYQATYRFPDAETGELRQYTDTFVGIDAYEEASWMARHVPNGSGSVRRLTGNQASAAIAKAEGR